MELVTGHAGTEHISAADMASLYRGLLVDDDVVLASGNQLECTMIDANTAEIGTGDCMLQAHHARVDVAEQLEVRSGSNGYNRNDLVVARYTLGTDNVQLIYLAIVEGVAVAGDAEDPDYATGDIDGGTTLVEFPLWRIPIRGVNVGTPERIMPTVDTLQGQIETLRDSVNLHYVTVTVGESAVASGSNVTAFVIGDVCFVTGICKTTSGNNNIAIYGLPAPYMPDGFGVTIRNTSSGQGYIAEIYYQTNNNRLRIVPTGSSFPLGNLCGFSFSYIIAQ